jgi:hypothetical protein
MVDDHVRDVTILMMIRHMPEDDFITLCERVLNSQGFTLDSDETMQQLKTPTDAHGRPRTICMICGETAPRLPLTARVEALAGLTACKRCIDASLLGLFTDQVEPGSLAAQLSVIFDKTAKAEHA